MESTSQNLSAQQPLYGKSDIDEEIESLSNEEKRSDELLNVNIRRSVNGEVFDGTVEDIEVGKQTRDRLYRIRYTDGDLEHLVREEVLECSFTNDNPKASGEHKTAPSADMSDIVERSTSEKNQKGRQGRFQEGCRTDTYQDHY